MKLSVIVCAIVLGPRKLGREDFLGRFGKGMSVLVMNKTMN